MICFALGEDLEPGRAMSSHTYYQQTNDLTKGRELETSGSPRNGLQEVEEKNLWTKLATPDSTQEAVMRLRKGPVSSGMALESQTAGIQGAL